MSLPPKMSTLSAVFKLKGRGGEEPRTFRFHKERLVVGSVVSADIRLGGNDVAPIHAVIELGDSVREAGFDSPAVVFDLASDSGVFVNGERVATGPLNAGSVLRIGTHELVLQLEEHKKEEPKNAGGTERKPESRAEKNTERSAEQLELSQLLLVEERDVQDIFDYRPTLKDALEVVISWRGTILDVQHFSRPGPVTVGPSLKADFPLAAVLGDGLFTLARLGKDRDSSGAEIQLHPQFKGVVQRKGQLVAIQAAPGRQGGGSLQLGVSDFAKLSAGEFDFYLSHTKAPPSLKRRKLFDRDPLLFKLMLTSLTLSAALIYALAQMKVEQKIEPEELPERIATILYQPPKLTPKPVPVSRPKDEVKPPEEKGPPKVPEKVKVDLEKKQPQKPVNVGQTGGPKSPGSQRAAKEGEGARAKGAEGQRGKKNAPRFKEHQTAAKRPSPTAGQGAGGAVSEVPGQGNVEALKGASSMIKDLLAGAGQKLGKGGSKMEGFGGFDSQGKGGLALQGSGSGGGGEVESVGGLGKKGIGGGRVGTGLGAAGDGSGLVGGKSRVVLKTQNGDESVVMGAIDAEAIEAAIRAHRDEFSLCYEREINAQNPSLAGRVGTVFVIGASGRVTKAAVSQSSLGNANVERCVLDVLKRIDFPIPKGGTLVEVSYPFKFNPVGR